MLLRNKRRVALPLGLLSLAAVATVVVAGGSNASPGTIPLHGKMRDIVQNRTCAASPIGVCSSFTATGDINGSGFVVIDTFPDAANFGFSKAHTVITTDKGDLHCHEAALFNLETFSDPHAFVDLCLIDGSGTGIYAGASGYIQEVGTFDFGSNVGNLDYYGSLTFAGGS